jgi:RNA ligase (TIGR02306 family)
MENNNSVCFVKSITEIKEIEGADNIELVVVGGWNCITKKGEYGVGERVVIATTDAVIPQELSDKMGVTNYLRKGQRVRTVKLRGIYSECLIIPTLFCKQQYLKEGDDKMEELGISKYEPPVKQIQLASGRKIKYRDNPNFHIYYKFPNLKNVQGMFTEEDVVQISRKLHGTNSRYGIVKKVKLSLWDKVMKFFRLADKWIDFEFIYGSHNVEKGSDSQGFYSTDVWKTIDEQYNIRGKLWDWVTNHESPETIGQGVVIYGEIYGAGIQKNYDYRLWDIRFAGFDITVNGKYMDVMFCDFIFNDTLKLPQVETLFLGNWNQETQDKFTFNNFIEGTKVPHEGIVVKHISGNRSKVAKIINPSYLIYGEKHDIGDSH